MKRRTKITLAVVGTLIVTGGGAAVLAGKARSGESDLKTVTVQKGEIVEKALAVGRIEPKVEVTVKSEISGVVKEEYADIGDFVRAGTPLLEIKPTPTPLELVEGQRQLEMRQLDLENAKKALERQKALLGQGLVSQGDYDTTERAYGEAELNVKLARERLALLKEGRVKIANARIGATVKSPIDGFILEKDVEVGDPVVALNPYQEGTVLMTMAEMKSLIFRGTVDEIDVGKLKEGMPAEIKIGALPDAKVQGVVSKISLKAKKEDNATVFPVELTVEPTDSTVLRAGYSANADIIIDRRQDVLTIPERLIHFSGDTARVTVALPDGSTEERIIQTGLSDAINIQVVSGLKEGDAVVEPPTRKIE